MTKIYYPYSVSVEGIPYHVKDVCPLHEENNTTSDLVTPLDPSDDATDSMVYNAMEENSSASSVSGALRQDEFSNMSEDKATGETELVPLRQSSEQEPEICTTEVTSKPAPSRWNGWQKQPAPHCPICDPEIRDECDDHEQDKCEEPFHRRSKSLRVDCVFPDCSAGGR